MTLYYIGKLLEIAGMVICAAALIAGMGLVDGQPSMTKEMMLLGVGGCVFTFGWYLERSK